MGSTRLPGKVIRPIGGKPLLEYILNRLSRLVHPATIVVATSDLAQDAPVADLCKGTGTECFKGSEVNVLERYYKCAQQHGFENVVRLTGDNPFTDLVELDRLIELHLTTRSELSHSFEALPVGVGAEIFTFDALEKCFRESSAPHHFEHVDEYMLENPGLFKTSRLAVAPAKNQPEICLTVDTEEDFRKACFIAEHAGDPVSTEEAIALCSRYA